MNSTTIIHDSAKPRRQLPSTRYRRRAVNARRCRPRLTRLVMVPGLH